MNVENNIKMARHHWHLFKQYASELEKEKGFTVYAEQEVVGYSDCIYRIAPSKSNLFINQYVKH